ncbi:hypothetical protein [Bacillus sp. 179-C3.3 HS]|uniref:hypothetical protein n=1 Tax=Bacillus sp. 179-C3.3 HS TaxID=3232162 RepID=UPI00399FD3F6
MSTAIVSIVSIVLWIVVIKELEKPSKEMSGRKVCTFMFAGSLSTVILTISFFQHHLF